MTDLIIKTQILKTPANTPEKYDWNDYQIETNRD